MPYINGNMRTAAVIHNFEFENAILVSVNPIDRNVGRSNIIAFTIIARKKVTAPRVSAYVLFRVTQRNRFKRY